MQRNRIRLASILAVLLAGTAQVVQAASAAEAFRRSEIAARNAECAATVAALEAFRASEIAARNASERQPPQQAFRASEIAARNASEVPPAQPEPLRASVSPATVEPVR